MIESLTYLVSSHVSYTRASTKLLESMLRGGVGIADVVVVVGGCFGDVVPLPESPDPSALRARGARHNSFDYTAAVELVRSGFRVGDHVFLLHDTMEFSPNTDRLIRQADPTKDVTAVFGGQCNLMLLRTDYLFSRADWLVRLENCTKDAAIAAEGQLWRDCPEDRRGHYPNSGCQEQGTGMPYGGATRIREHYGAIDLIKWKANWGQPGERVLRC